MRKRANSLEKASGGKARPRPNLVSPTRFHRLEEEKPSQFPFKNEKKEHKIEEVVIPTQMRRWAASISGLTAFFAPAQEMANVFAKEITIAHKKGPLFAPFVTPKPHERPWRIDLPIQERANKAWKDSEPRKSKGSPHQLSFQAWTLYILRFVLVGDLLDAWSAFGGLSAQLSHLSISLHLADTESGAVAIMYDAEVRALIQRLARLRGDDADFVKILTGGNGEIKQRLKNERGKTKAEKATDKSSNGDKNGEKG